MNFPKILGEVFTDSFMNISHYILDVIILLRIN